MAYAESLYKFSPLKQLEHCNMEYARLHEAIMNEKTYHGFLDGRMLFLGNYVNNINKYSKDETKIAKDDIYG